MATLRQRDVQSNELLKTIYGRQSHLSRDIGPVIYPELTSTQFTQVNPGETSYVSSISLIQSGEITELRLGLGKLNRD